MSGDEIADGELVGGDGDTSQTRWVVCAPGPSADDLVSVHPDYWQVREGVDYVAGWREGQRLVQRAYRFFARCGLTDGVEFTPYVQANGRGTFSVRVDADAFMDFVQILAMLGRRMEVARTLSSSSRGAA